MKLSTLRHTRKALEELKLLLLNLATLLFLMIAVGKLLVEELGLLRR
jgi:hypothetical protein